MTEKSEKPRLAIITHRPSQCRNWLIVFTNSSGGETCIDTGWAFCAYNIVDFPVGDWAKQHNVEFACGRDAYRWSMVPSKCRNFEALQHEWRNAKLAEQRSIQQDIENETAARLTRETIERHTNAECEACGKRFWILGGILHGTELRHVEGHDDVGTPPEIVSDEEKARREQAEKAEAQERAMQEIVTTNFHGPSYTLNFCGTRRNQMALQEALNNGSIKFT